MRHFRQVFHEVMEFTVVDAPFICDDAPPRELMRFLQQGNDRFRSWLKFSNWEKSENLSPDCVYGLEESTKFIGDVLRKQGPFDGVLAFSQGGIIWRHFYQITQMIDTESYKDQHGNPLFKVPEFMISVASPVFPKMKFYYKGIEYLQVSQPMFDFPSMHLNGSKDKYFELCKCA